MIEFPLRFVVDLNIGWEFVQGRVNRNWLSGRSRAAEVVDLPHCWNTDDTYQTDRNSARGFGAYRREIELPPATFAGDWHLVTDGFYGIGEVWLDGRRLFRFDAQFLGLDHPLPSAITNGPHLLSLRLDNRFHRNVLPGKKVPDFLLYGGLAGGMRLEHRPRHRIEDRSLEVVGRPQPDGSEMIELCAAITGPVTDAGTSALQWTISTDRGDLVAETEVAAADGASQATVRIPDPRCWSPDHPNLYLAECRLVADDGPADAARIRFGLPRAEFCPGAGLHLDGDRVDLHGANRHESIPGLGSCLSPELHRFDARLLKDLGCNFVRLSHYPQHPEFLDACDELGIMVYPEIATWKSVSSMPGWRRAARRQMHDLILRDRHHPSVVLWGMGNESRSRRAYLELREIAHELDPDRPVTYAENHLYRAKRRKTIGIPDVWGVNYELDVLDEARDASRLGLVILSECCNHPRSIRGDEIEELTQLAVIEREWEIMAGREYLLGHAVWSLTDYATEYRNRTRRQAGLFDAWRQPKMAAELVRARYARTPFVSLFCTRNRVGAPASRFRTEVADPWGGRSPFRLHVLSNCASLRVAQNGDALICVEATPHTVIPVDLAKGEIIVDGLNGGETVTRSIRQWGQPTSIRVERPAVGQPVGEIVMLDLRIVDHEGVTVPTWTGHLGATATGGARVMAYTAQAEVLVTRGEGRLFVRTSPGDVAPAVEITHPSLQTGRFRLGAAEESSA